MSLIGSFNLGTTGLVAQSVRLNTIASNIANAETAVGPDGQPYRARQVVFQADPVRNSNSHAMGVKVARIVESDAPLRMEYRPGHPLANEQGYVAMPNVNPAEQMVDMVAASRAYQFNVEMMNVTRQLMLKTLDLGK
jgi:flagellar basal-body rod protein FlgC